MDTGKGDSVRVIITPIPLGLIEGGERFLARRYEERQRLLEEQIQERRNGVVASIAGVFGLRD